MPGSLPQADSAVARGVAFGTTPVRGFAIPEPARPARTLVVTRFRKLSIESRGQFLGLPAALAVAVA